MHPMPAYATEDMLLEMRNQIPMLADFWPNSLLVQRYDPRSRRHLAQEDQAQIKVHNDNNNEGGTLDRIVVGVSFGHSCIMTFVLGDRTCNVQIPPGSVYVMTGPSMTNWFHGILPGNIDGLRVSFTYRIVHLTAL